MRGRVPVSFLCPKFRKKGLTNVVNGPEDTVLSEMIKFWPLEKNCTLSGALQVSWKIVELVFCRIQMRKRRRGSEVHSADIGDVNMLRLEKERTDLDETADGRDQWDKLPTLKDDDDEVTAKKHWE